MRHFTSTLAATAGLAACALARDVPENLKNLVSSVKSRNCGHYLQTGFYDEEGGSKNFGYCGDHLKDDGIIYIQGPKGKLANMDIDCDGQQHGAGDDGRCGSSGDTQSQTSFQDQVRQYSGNKIKDLNAFVHTYVVFGNDDTNPSFKPEQYGMEPLGLMAVVCGDKLIYGIWGDTNGNDGPPLVGEAAISTATLCFGKGVNGNSGHDQEDVMYIGFTGKNTVPKNAAWTAKSAADFEQSLATLGDSLVAKIGGGSGSANATTVAEPTKSSSSSTPTKSATKSASKGGKDDSDDSDNGDDSNDDGDDGDNGDNGDDE